MTAVAALLTVLGIIAVVYSQGIDFFGLIGALILIFLAAVVLGMVIRFIRATPGNRIREAFGPIMGAGDSYQSLMMGRPTVDESSAEAQRMQRANKAMDDAKEDRW
ncbi:MAG: hypothetical protein L0K41_10680 [Yaniella sp.]|uniref:hypothetical protein n=1 Tax=Yaniella sp. TaxID=2773929 RepID=UPI00264953A6|nr:hypothetical protein [Yaniella sp.]MDN5705383.1 hypothetical protein [Yaniella sp.]MDN5731992.1 hypothetical protein [Yaniella sp.]MDN5814960.1 hypothetical protein [Yaniella sp.]MDN5817856.1 hypothetical protein [Yaniella sp.]MDN5839011.1 hypothetical protein [Yaniella sp.]